MPSSPPPGTGAGQPEMTQFDVFNIYGPNLIGAFLSCIALGVVWSAICGYYYRYPKDSSFAKTFVTSLGILATAEAFVICFSIIKIAAVHAGDIPYALKNQFDNLGWIRAIFGSLIAFLTQLFMIHRFMTFFRALSFNRDPSRTRMLFWIGSILLSSLALLGLGAGIANAIYLSTLKSVYEVAEPTSKAREVFQMIWNIQFTSLLVLDSILTILFSFKLQRFRTGFAKSNRVIDVLIITLLRNGLLMTVLQLATSVLFMIDDKYTIWLCIPSALIYKVYVLTVIAILTKPRDTQEKLYSEETINYKLPGVSDEDKYTGGRSTCQSCRNSRFKIGSERRRRKENSSGFTLEEFLSTSNDQSSSKNGNDIRQSIIDIQQHDKYLDFETGSISEVKTDDSKGLIIQIEKDEQVFISPSDYSPQATRQPRLGVMGENYHDYLNELEKN